MVYYESFETPNRAIAREKEIKGWKRVKKDLLVSTKNPKWEDIGIKLFPELFELLKKRTINFKKHL